MVLAGADESGDTIEILNAQFQADEEAIFGKRSDDYVARELDWYLSQSRDVNDMEPPVPKIWSDVATWDGKINSNYGWCVFSKENGLQFDHCRDELVRNPLSRRACMIYQRPSIHRDAFVDGMSDFICTDAVHCFVRNDQLHYSVYMRSNDAVFGYKNDLAWHQFVRTLLVDQLERSGRVGKLRPAVIAWHAASLHVYRRHFDLVKEES